MCGRFTLRLSPEELQQIFDVMRAPEWTPRFNIAPTQNVVILREQAGERELSLARWGLIPSWAKDESMGARMINARSETIHEKPSFRTAFKSQRCLVVADGFYEWKPDGKKKQPHFIRLANEQPFAFAGLWETWGDLETCTIVTTAANDLLKPMHERMPVILSPVDYDIWLDPNTIKREPLEFLFESYPAHEMKVDPVSTYVSNARNEGPDCLRPADKTLF